MGSTSSEFLFKGWTWTILYNEAGEGKRRGFEQL
jgi:hypothetical protein